MKRKNTGMMLQEASMSQGRESHIGFLGSEFDIKYTEFA